MLDHKIYTFLKLCELMNYRETAEALNMTQPAVTQHIQMLEQEYKCKLFSYNGRKLNKTTAGLNFEKYARSAVYNETIIRKQLSVTERIEFRLGATKTIGSYVIDKQVQKLVMRDDINFSLTIYNTEYLLLMLDHSNLDIAIIEGFFDKQQYDYTLMKNERFLGICSKEHKFAGKSVSFEDLFDEKLIVREKGSGTRAILEQVLFEKNYSLNSFSNFCSISSFKLIKNLVLNNCGISFVYEAIANSDKNLATFTIDNTDVYREFNYVYLKGTSADKYISYLQ